MRERLNIRHLRVFSGERFRGNDSLHTFPLIFLFYICPIQTGFPLPQHESLHYLCSRKSITIYDKSSIPGY